MPYEMRRSLFLEAMDMAEIDHDALREDYPSYGTTGMRCPALTMENTGALARFMAVLGLLADQDDTHEVSNLMLMTDNTVVDDRRRNPVYFWRSLKLTD